jgi:type IV pilus assembly protein PilO
MDINLSLGRLPWYGQVGVFALLVGGGVGVFYTYYASPAQEAIAQKQAQIDTLRVEIQKGVSTAARLPQFRKEIAARETELVSLRAQLPEEQDVADLLRRVQAMATQSNLRIRGFTPRTVARKQMHMEWPIGLQLEGTYHDLGDFLERVSKFDRVINVGDITIRAKDLSTDGTTITAEFTATTFVLIETAAPPAPAPAPAQPAGSAE